MSCKLGILLLLLINKPVQPLWPKPQRSIISGDSLPISQSFAFETGSLKCEVLEKAIKRYKVLAFINDCSLINRKPTMNDVWNRKPLENSKKCKNCTDEEVEQLTIKIERCEKYPHLEMNEAYKLSIRSDAKGDEKATLTARTNWGAIRGLETFSQLITFDKKTASFRVK